MTWSNVGDEPGRAHLNEPRRSKGDRLQSEAAKRPESAADRRLRLRLRLIANGLRDTRKARD